MEDNFCVRDLLTIVARGSAIIAELHRLIELVPAPYRPSEGNNLSTICLDKERKFTLNDLICDFAYFKEAESFESRIEANEDLRRADESLCDKFIDIITRFYLTFESIQRYALDLNNFVREVEDENFVGQSLDDLLLDNESLQLLCEAYYLLGYMLITTDNNFEGALRERLIVSYYRYSSYKSNPGSNLDDTCNLMRSTGFRTAQQQTYRTTSFVRYYRPEGYPESFFSRVGVNQSVVSMLIAKLQSKDIYNQTVSAFPHPDHRSTALAQQASMLYVLLYFCPNILNSQRSRMREITDKFFYDSWVLSVHMGELVNLIEAWDPYRCARESLAQVLEHESIQALSSQYKTRFFLVAKQVENFLREGWLNENSVLENHPRILNQIREANVVLKWMLLHSQLLSTWTHKLTQTTFSTVTRDIPDRKSLFGFLQNISELEKKFSFMCAKIMDKRKDMIEENRSKAIETLKELVEIFNGTKPMRWVEAASSNSKLIASLTQLTTELENVDFAQTTSRDKVIKLVNEIKSAQDSYIDGKSLQVVQLVIETTNNLIQILRFINLTSDTVIALRSISEFGYAWRIMDQTFTKHMQQIIKDEPLKVYSIESIFLKLASAFDSCLMRIQQIDSQEDLISVSQYYSTKLVSYISDVLHIIPTTILELLASIISIQTEHVMGDMPSKVSLDSLKEYSLPEKRFQMLELTFKISHYSESMMMMHDTTIGLIRVNSKQLLDDGIRRELVKRMCDSIQSVLQFADNQTKLGSNFQVAQNLLAKLTRLDVLMNGYKRSFEYIQDYLFIYGLRMWQEELSRIVKFNVEQAIEVLLNDSFLQDSYSSQATDHEQSIYQSAKAPIPVYGTNPFRSSFIVRILNEILKITNPRTTIYDEQMSAWYEQRAPRDKVMDLKVLELVTSSLCVTGLNGIDQVCCTLLMLELQRLDTLLISMAACKSQASQALMEALAKLLAMMEQSDKNDVRRAQKIFSAAIIKIAPFSDKVITYLLRIGQLQAIRTNISCVLSTKCRYEARHVYDSLEALNTSLMSTLKHSQDLSCQQKSSEERAANSVVEVDQGEPNSTNLSRSSQEEKKANNFEDSSLLFELANHLDWVGLSDPMSKVYTMALQTCHSSQVYEFRERHTGMELIFLILLEQCSKFHFSRSINGFIPKQSRSFYETDHTVDGQPLFYGLITLINHYQPFLSTTSSNSSAHEQVAPLRRLLELMSFYVKSLLDNSSCSIKPQDLTLEVVNMILSIIELIRLARQPPNELLSGTLLPEFIFDTFQFTLCNPGSPLSNISK